MEVELNKYMIKDLVNLVSEYHYPNYKRSYRKVIDELHGVKYGLVKQMNKNPVKCYGFLTYYAPGWKHVKTFYYCSNCDNLNFIPMGKAQCWKNH